jgi:hypothetical protein
MQRKHKAVFDFPFFNEGQILQYATINKPESCNSIIFRHYYLIDDPAKFIVVNDGIFLFFNKQNSNTESSVYRDMNKSYGFKPEGTASPDTDLVHPPEYIYILFYLTTTKFMRD